MHITPAHGSECTEADRQPPNCWGRQVGDDPGNDGDEQIFAHWCGRRVGTLRGPRGIAVGRLGLLIFNRRLGLHLRKVDRCDLVMRLDCRDDEFDTGQHLA